LARSKKNVRKNPPKARVIKLGIGEKIIRKESATANIYKAIKANPGVKHKDVRKHVKTTVERLGTAITHLTEQGFVTAKRTRLGVFYTATSIKPKFI